MPTLGNVNAARQDIANLIYTYAELIDAGDFDVTGHRGKWATTWARGREPF